MMGKGRTKYGKPDRRRVQNVQPTLVDGIRFDSKREARRWQDLLLLQRAGEISHLQRQVPFPLMGKHEGLKTPTGRQMKYVADFQYFDHKINALVIEDAKGWATDVYKIKKAILAAQGVVVVEV